MKRYIPFLTILLLSTVWVDCVQAAMWYTITFTGADLFKYTRTTDELYNQDAPRRVREWPDDTSPTPNWVLWSDTDSDGDGTNDYAEWADENLTGYGFSYFNLWGATIAPDYWDQPYHAVPDNGDGTYGVNSWRNQTVNGVPVINSMGDPYGWAGGIVMANQPYNTTNYAFPVWRAPIGTRLTMENAADLVFSVEVLIENEDTAFEPDGTLRVWFGGFDQPQDWTGVTTEISGIMIVPEPATLGLLALGGLLLRKRGV
ncbi:MAG TPA: PEP-CTERM sorting domain-containing protein [Anaerohalosphaeraceae bacterium]|nr:PEP-CTERM sorting domain-containing protein [Anaerohalosphaeraceae bacterium]HOL90047.1 PEP-CTERM sorting domain-containing protein [Anaerohalosphaeraceae bacterium]HPP56804.1 PEP-CTERM sorting domain-containing protein [Anaerohalosphaeraceae bacterium]